MKSILMVAGESSADRYAGRLIRELRHVTTPEDLEVFGMGGFFMRDAGATLTADFGGLSHIGPLEAAASLQRYWMTFRALLQEAKFRQPPLAILLDFPDFNLPLAKRLKRMGIRVFYYISPQIWAWRRRRVRTIARWVDRMFVIFPFEADFYRRHGIDAEFVGHPLLEKNHSEGFERGSIRRMLRVRKDQPLVSLFPGSREKEISYILPSILEAAVLISKSLPCHFAIAKANGIESSFVKTIWHQTARTHTSLADGTIPIDLVDWAPEEALADSDVAIVKSGTSTLQAALAETPFVMVYKISALSWAIGKTLIRTPHYCIVNLIAGKKVVPELMQADATPKHIADETLQLLKTPERRREMREEFRRVRSRLGAVSASKTVANRIVRELRLDTGHIASGG